MNFSKPKNNCLSLLALACITPFSIENAQAISSFSSSTEITYTINSITNLDNAGGFTGLSIDGSFSLDNFNSFTSTTGNGSTSASPASAGPTSLAPIVGSSFSETFLANGSATNGSANASYLGLYGLEFDNISSDSFQISVQVNYLLTANASGDNADTTILLDYFNADEAFFGNASAFASVPLTPSDIISNSVTYNFTLAANSFDALYVDANIEGNLVSTVPLPAAFWLFATALFGLPGIRKLNAIA
jgi:hypothetical protein